MSSPWSRNAPPTQAVTLPPPPSPPQSPTAGMTTRPHRWPWVAAALLVVGLSIGTGSSITYIAIRDNKPSISASTSPQPTKKSTAPVPELTATQIAEAKNHLCQAFDLSVRGQGGQGGLRVEGQLNVPMVLRSLNSATVVQNALVPAVPQDVAAAAKSYVAATLDQTTAAMGNSPTSEVNHLTDLRNAAGNALLDACGIPR